MSALEIKEKQINTLVITKKVNSQQLLLRELVGSALFDLNQGANLTMGIEEGQLSIKKLDGESLDQIWSALSVSEQDLVIEKLAKKLKAVKRAHDQGGGLLVGEVMDLLGFVNLVDKNLRFLEKTRDLNEKNKFLLTNDLLSLRKTSSEDLTLVHGDLNLGNIIRTGQDLALIDFEHVTEGPIEFELCPSIFWDDHMSLPFKRLIFALKKVGITVSALRLSCTQSLYFVNQLRIAKEEKAKTKVQLLKKLAKQRGIIN